MIKIKSLLICLFLFTFISCTNKPKTQKKDTAEDTITEAPEKPEIEKRDEPPPPNFSYQTIVNERYAFSCEIPEMWKAKDKSSSGDGFYIETGDAGVDCRVYGTSITGIDDIDNAGMHCDAVGEFAFSDGMKGTKCVDDGTLYFFYNKNKKRTTFYVKAPLEWKKKNIDIINHIAESITMSAPA